jgi:type VI secretion system secreted protein Hcp
MTGAPNTTDTTDAVATRRAVLAGALGVGALGTMALGPGLAEAAAAAPIPTNPTSDYFLRVDGIPGSSTDARHVNWIDLLTFSWGASTTVSPLATTSGSPAAQSKPADFVAQSSVASPRLFLACARGTAINNVALEVVRVGGDRPTYLKVNLQNVRVASYNEAPSAGDGIPLDVVHLRYAKVVHIFVPQRPDGSMGPEVRAGFDFAANVAI